MAKYNIIVNNVQKSENEIVCLARVDNYRKMLKHVSIGESITTLQPINLNFHNSIGASKWVLIFYPKGQYILSENSAILENGRVSMYLKMISCENQDSSLMTTVKCFIKSPYFEVKDKFARREEVHFLYRDVNKRWTGPFNIVSLTELYSKKCDDFFVNDCLTIGCELVVSHYEAIQRSNIYVGIQFKDKVEQRQEKQISYGRLSLPSSSVSLDDTDKKLRKLRKSYNKNINYDLTDNSDQMWHKRLMKTSIEGMARANNENYPPNHQLIVKSRERATTAAVFEVPNNDTGYCVKKTIDYFENLSVSRD